MNEGFLDASRTRVQFPTPPQTKNAHLGGLLAFVGRQSFGLRFGFASAAGSIPDASTSAAPTRNQFKSHRRQVELEQRAWLNRRSLTRKNLLWRELSARKLGVQFRRQVPIAGRFIADFVAPAVKLIVEVDGGYHRTRECADARGMRCWRGWGIARCGFRRRRGV